MKNKRGYTDKKHFNTRNNRPEPVIKTSAGREITVTIENFAYGGDGMARFENSTVYIPYALPKSTVKAVITEENNRVIQARVKNVITQS
ncbi:MAG TPA: TRAM domain-containing protein, partial [Candidatus Goldiibacteriota bacterium]|nr:TRAM domain-containing protein [Candidatus Goldiibacteriota bacterium]